MKFEKTVGTLLVATTLLSLGCSAAPLSDARQLKENNSRIYTYESDASGFHTKTFFYDNGEEVVAFDSQFTPDLARKSIAFLRTKTDRPITNLVVTHPNPDKFNGLSAFQEIGAKVVASSRTADAMKEVHEYKKYFFVKMAKMFTEETYPKLGQIDIRFEKSFGLRLKNGETILLRELAQPGVSRNQTVASIPAVNAAIVGDLVHHKAHAWLEGGIENGKPTPTLAGWIAGLEELRSLFKDAPETLVYGGRGEVAKVQEAVESQIAYLNKADTLVSQYIKSLGARQSELRGENAGEHHKAIQTEFEKAFPAYTLGYMIQYGVYGLVNSKL